MAGAKLARRHDQRLQRDQLVAHRGQVVGERGCGRGEPPTSPSQPAAPTGSVYQGSSGRRPRNGTRWMAAIEPAHPAGVEAASAGSTSTHPYTRTGQIADVGEQLAVPP